MKSYKLEVWMTLVCFIVVAITGGFLSSIFVIAHGSFFNQVPTPEQLVSRYGETMFVVKNYVMGFPLHYLLLILFSWIGATLIGVIWSLVMDRIEERQHSSNLPEGRSLNGGR